MKLRNLAGLNVPPIGMGSWKTFDVFSDAEVSVRRRIIDECVANDVSFIDSSPMYGRSEEVIGVTAEGRREKLQLATKVWCEGREAGEAQIARSFELLRTDHVDVLQVHNLVDWRTHLSTLERLKAEGKIGVIGITHYDTGAYPAMLEIMKSGRVGAIQIPYNVGERECEGRVLPLAADLGIGVIVMEPLEKGLYATGLKREPDLSRLAGAGIKTWAQALLAWVLADERVSVAIPATSRPERVSENAHAADVSLDDNLRDYVREETMRCI